MKQILRLDHLSMLRSGDINHLLSKHGTQSKRYQHNPVLRILRSLSLYKDSSVFSDSRVSNRRRYKLIVSRYNTEHQNNLIVNQFNAIFTKLGIRAYAYCNHIKSEYSRSDWYNTVCIVLDETPTCQE